MLSWSTLSPHSLVTSFCLAKHEGGKRSTYQCLNWQVRSLASAGWRTRDAAPSHLVTLLLHSSPYKLAPVPFHQTLSKTVMMQANSHAVTPFCIIFSAGFVSAKTVTPWNSLRRPPSAQRGFVCILVRFWRGWIEWAATCYVLFDWYVWTLPLMGKARVTDCFSSARPPPVFKTRSYTARWNWLCHQQIAWYLWLPRDGREWIGLLDLL